MKNLMQLLVFVLRANISRLRRAVVGKNVEGLLVNTKQGLFLVDPEDLGVGASLINKGEYGGDEIQRICSLANEGGNVLFVGSHIGALAIPTSKKVKHVTAIEANPDTFILLSRNIVLNNCDNIRAIQIAASDQRGELDFVLNKTNSGGSKRMPVIKTYKYFYDRPSVVRIKTDRLDVAAPDEYKLVVMDIEGSEYFALKGMPVILSKASYLIMEFVPHHLKNVSNVSVQELLVPIEPYFDRLNIPSKRTIIDRSQFRAALEQMYDLNECDDGIVFSKETFNKDVQRQPLT